MDDTGGTSTSASSTTPSVPMQQHHALRAISKKRTTNFREDETKLLIQLWGSPQIQNKLYLTHRKEPVMRILAANMQQHGFFRTADEIKTRIRNLKCLYHRIKRTVQSGAGIGTVDPDWPHYKAMDKILTEHSQKRESLLYRENVFDASSSRCQQDDGLAIGAIKQEIVDDFEVNDDMESLTTGSEFEEEHNMPLPPLTPAPTTNNTTSVNKETSSSSSSAIKKQPEKPSITVQKTYSNLNRTLPKILPNLTAIQVQPPKPNNNLTISKTNNVVANNNNNNNKNGKQPPQQQPTQQLPFPLLIFGGLPPNAQVQAQLQETRTNSNNNNGGKDSSKNNTIGASFFTPSAADTATAVNNMLLKELLEIQKENLDVEKKRLELEKQRLDFEQFVAHQLLAMGPVFSGLLQKILLPNGNPGNNVNNGSKGGTSSSIDDNNSAEINEDNNSGDSSKKNRKRLSTNDIEAFKDSKILKNLLSEGIKQFMMEGEDDNEEEDDSDNDVRNEEVSNDSEK